MTPPAAPAIAVGVGGAPGTVPVVNDQLVVASAAPARSRIDAAPPVSLTVYVVFAARSAVGFRIHWFVVPFRVTPALTSVPAPLRSWNVVPLTPFTASLNVAVTLAPTTTPVAFTAGARAVRVGAGFTMAPAVVKD